MSGAPDDLDAVHGDFTDAVTITPEELREWLATDESRGVGDASGGGESTGHESGRRITRWRYSLMNWGHDPLKG